MTPDPHPHPHPHQHPAQAHAVSYQALPVGEVTATEAAIEALGRTRRWATLAAIILLGGGALGLLFAAYIGLIFIINQGNPDFVPAPNAIIGGFSGFYGVMGLVAGVLLVSFIRATTRTYRHRRPEDLERAMVTLSRFIFWMSLCLAGAAAFPFVVFGIGLWVGAFP